ncbi:unnamed protein product [Microthlaspi erraticum]|uniref:Uncharacterized protein n=1 Tax=Microthlaspi erraticum TaxID=1685480 RepID=A0A6D2IYI5_9BRAS|nr:unnamed protein product [Microthlaspi erraticum]
MREKKLLDMGIKPIISRTRMARRSEEIGHCRELMPLLDSSTYKITAYNTRHQEEESLVLEGSSHHLCAAGVPTDKRSLLHQVGWTSSFARPTFSLSTRSWMGDSNSKEPELDRAEDRAEIKLKISPGECDLGEPECYYFEEYEAPRMNPSVVAAHKRIGLLQKFNKWQGKAMERCKSPWTRW